LSTKGDSLSGVSIDTSNFPDENFRLWVISNIPGAEDGYLTDSEIESITEIEDYKNHNIESIEGIELFRNLKRLTFMYNRITSFDGSQMNSLESIDLCFNQLTEIKYSPNVIGLHLNGNKLTKLNLRNLPALTNLSVSENLLTELDLSNNPELVHVQFSDNRLLCLDLHNNQKIKTWTSDGTNMEMTLVKTSKGIGFPVPNNFRSEFVNSLKLDNKEISGSLVSENGKNHFIIAPLETNESEINGKILTYQYYTQNNFVGYYPISLSLCYISPIVHTLSIQATGNGSATYSGEDIRETTKTYTINEETNVTVNFTPDNGNRIKSLKVNGSSVTASSSYSTTINKDTSIEVVFEEIPPTTHTLSIKATGNGSALYSGESIRGKTKTYTVNEGTSVTISFTPDNGYRIKSLKVNGSSVTASTSYKTTINADTSIEVVFEEIPATTYTLSIKATGNGSASYSGESIRGKTKTYAVNGGTSVTITFTPDDGYRIKSLKVNGSSVTATNNYKTTVNADTSIEVVFEEIPPTTYTLSIKATGNGSASYSGETIRGKTKTYTVNEGTSVTISFTPDNGYRIKSLKVNGSSVTITSSYTTTINADTSIEVEFEEIPDTPTTYSLTIKATGNGSASYGGEMIRNTKKSYTVDEGASVTITFSPDDGYRIKSLKVNNVDATVSDSYTIKVNADTKVEVEFEEIPVTTYSLSIKAVGKGSATYKNTTVRDDNQAFTVNEGSDVTIAFIPDDGYRIKMVKHDGVDVTSNMIDNSYTISDIHADATVEVEFEERVNSFTEDGISYQVTSWEGYALTVVAADDGLVLEIPDKISNQDEEWTVTGIDGNVLDDHEILAAIIWNPEALFTARVTNPNLLLYVKDEQYAPATIKNVVVNGYANSITLTDAQSGNNFYCPRAFTAGIISYSHRYWMKTGINESRGWETLALPFDVQKISHSTKGEITPFANWHDGDSTYPFWLYQLRANGFIEADAIKANTPYIISMPNNDRYSTEYHLNGRVDFTAKNVEVKRSDDIQTSAFSDRTFIPNFVEQGKNAGYYALNVNNEYEVYQGEEAEGSKFVLNLRQIHPFEAYMTTASNTRSIGIFDDMTTCIKGIEEVAFSPSDIKVYDLSGRLVKTSSSMESISQELPVGVYIVNNRKMIIK